MRVTPEVILNLPRYHCLASWIVDGQRASSFILQTKPMEDRHALGRATIHREAQRARVGEYPEQMAGFCDASSTPARRARAEARSLLRAPTPSTRVGDRNLERRALMLPCLRPAPSIPPSTRTSGASSPRTPTSPAPTSMSVMRPPSR